MLLPDTSTSSHRFGLFLKNGQVPFLERMLPNGKKWEIVSARAPDFQMVG
jgi:hypothetical protein